MRIILRKHNPRKKNLLKNKLRAKKNDGALFSFGYQTTRTCDGAYVCLLRVRAIFPPHHPRARVCATPIFRSLRHQSFFARIYLPAPERAPGERFLGGLISPQFVFAKVRGGSPGALSRTNLKGISPNGMISLIMHLCVK